MPDLFYITNQALLFIILSLNGLINIESVNDATYSYSYVINASMLQTNFALL